MCHGTLVDGEPLIQAYLDLPTADSPGKQTDNGGEARREIRDGVSCAFLAAKLGSTVYSTDAGFIEGWGGIGANSRWGVPKS